MNTTEQKLWVFNYHYNVCNINLNFCRENKNKQTKTTHNIVDTTTLYSIDHRDMLYERMKLYNIR